MDTARQIPIVSGTGTTGTTAGAELYLRFRLHCICLSRQLINFVFSHHNMHRDQCSSVLVGSSDRPVPISIASCYDSACRGSLLQLATFGETVRFATLAALCFDMLASQIDRPAPASDLWMWRDLDTSDRPIIALNAQISKQPSQNNDHCCASDSDGSLKAPPTRLMLLEPSRDCMTVRVLR